LTMTERKLVKRPGQGSLLELLVIVAVAIGLALLIQAFLVKPYRIPSESMEPTLDVGQRVLVSRFNYKFSDPDRLDIVVFHPPAGANSNTCGAAKPEDQACSRPTPQKDSTNFIKRIVAVGGDILSIQNGHAIVNSESGGVTPVLVQVANEKREAERVAILAALRATKWNRRQASVRLQTDYKGLLYKMKVLSIKKEKAVAVPLTESREIAVSSLQ